MKTDRGNNLICPLLYRENLYIPFHWSVEYKVKKGVFGQNRRDATRKRASTPACFGRSKRKNLKHENIQIYIL